MANSIVRGQVHAIWCIFPNCSITRHLLTQQQSARLCKTMEDITNNDKTVVVIRVAGTDRYPIQCAGGWVYANIHARFVQYHAVRTLQSTEGVSAQVTGQGDIKDSESDAQTQYSSGNSSILRSRHTVALTRYQTVKRTLTLQPWSYVFNWNLKKRRLSCVSWKT